MPLTLAFNQLLNGTTTLSRRDLIKGVGASIAAAALLALAERQITQAALPEVAGEALQRATFAALLGQAFRVSHESATLPTLRLAEVRNLSALGQDDTLAATGDLHTGSFSLLFSASTDQAIPQGTYRFEHDRLGSFLLFIVPMAPNKRSLYYEAVFNRQQA